MNEIKEKLRADFYAKTDISVSISPESWQKYAQWLEEIASEKINNELLVKYNRLAGLIEKVIEILERGITER